MNLVINFFKFYIFIKETQAHNLAESLAILLNQIIQDKKKITDKDR